MIIATDVVYLEMNDHEYLVDMYVPAGDGPWPVVVALHGVPVYKSNSVLTVIAKAAAEAGMLVFAPNWAAEWPIPSAERMRLEMPALPCALAFAQQEAARYGGDPDRTVVYGHSGCGVGSPNVILAAPSEKTLTNSVNSTTGPLASSMKDSSLARGSTSRNRHDIRSALGRS